MDEVFQPHYIPEKDEILQILQRTLQSNRINSERDFQRFKLILEKYQENPQLLDPLLQQIVAPLAAALKDHGLQPNLATRQHKSHYSSRMLWVIACVRGYKVIIKLFPHEASDLLPAVELLENSGEKEGSWENQCIILLWLSQLITLPFPLAILDSKPSGVQASQEESTTQPLEQRILHLCQRHLVLPGSSRDMAAKLLGRFLTRPDTGDALSNFLQWCEETGESDHRIATFLVPGQLQTMCDIAGNSSQDVIKRILPHLWSKARQLGQSDMVKRSAKTRKLLIKFIQRLGIVLISTTSAENALPEELEDVLEILLQGLDDSDTIVRWSAAKGVGRVSSKLPAEFGAEVVAQVLELLEGSPSATAWHGACLTLAECARRRVLILQQLHEMAPKIAKALQLDIRRGAHRDAAAYVCWATAKAYPPDTLLPVMQALAPALLTAACYDREVSCRRAASAAFQEIVGRHGSFPHGIDILTAADYFALSSTPNAFLVVAPAIASYEEYGKTMATHLLEVKLRHWEASIRDLAARGLAALVFLLPETLSGPGLDYLTSMCTSNTLEARHGALLGLGELILSLKEHSIEVTDDRLHAIAEIPKQVSAAKLLRGKGGELIRSALCRLIMCCSDAGVRLTGKQQSVFQDLLAESLQLSNHSTQAQAVAAFSAFFRQYHSSGQGEVARQYMQGLRSETPAIRRGSASALGALPGHLLRPCACEVLLSLAAATKIEKQKELRDAESRTAAVQAIAKVLKEVFDSPDPGPPQQGKPSTNGDRHSSGACASNETVENQDLYTVVSVDVAQALTNALQDYSIDSRGDVGSWVREASMKSLVVLLAVLSKPRRTVDNNSFSELTKAALKLLLQQAVERIARVRQTAMTQLEQVVRLDLEGLGIPSLAKLQKTNWAPAMRSISSYEGIFTVSHFLAEEAYREPILLGFVYSSGGIDGPLADAVTEALNLHSSSVAMLDAICQSFLALWSQHSRSRRLAIPCLKIAQRLLSLRSAGFNHPLNGHLAEKLLDLLEKGSEATTVERSTAAATALCQMAPVSSEHRKRAFSHLLALLVSDIVLVRKFTAEQLYLKLLEDVSPDADRLSDLLLTTSWDSKSEAEAAKKNLADALLC